MLNINQINTAFSTLSWLARVLSLFALASLLNACAITPSTIVQTPTTAKPIAPKQPSAASGAIYSVSSHRALFEDRRARMVGDILTINITENTSANKAGSSASSKSGSVDSSVPIPLGLPYEFMKEAISISADSSLDNDDSATENASNNFNGNITVTVVEVLANGNLLVSGEKQIALDKGTEFVRFSGVVNPDNITIGNVVSSTKVADARVEYRTNTKLDVAQIASIFARFFLSFSPI